MPAPMKPKPSLAQQLADLWDEHEQHMGEQAAYMVACEQLGIDPDDGYLMLAELSDAAEE